MLFNYFENVNNIIPGDDNINGQGIKLNNIISGQIWLGNMKAALDPKFIKENNISVIINASVDIPFIFDVLDPAEYGISKLETYRIPVYDSLLEHDIYIMEQYLHKVLPFLLKKLLKEKKNILIHCAAGRQRSGCVVAALLYVLIDNNLMKLENEQIGGGIEEPKVIDKNKLMKRIIKYIIKRRPQAFSYGLRVNFKSSLERFFNIKI